MNVPPSRSSCESLPSRVRWTISFRSAAIWTSDLRSTSRWTGTIEAALGGDGEPDVRVREDPELVVGEVRVHLAVAQERDRRELREDVRHAHALVAQPLVELLRARHVRGHRDLERGRLPGFGQAARDRLAERRERDDLGLERRGADRGVRGRGRGALDVLGDDPPFGAGPGQAREVDAALARDAAGQRRRLDPPVGARRFLLLGVAPRRRLAAALALLLARGRRRAFLLLVLVDLDCGLLLVLGDVLALLADDRDPLADLDLLALAGEDLQQDAARVGLDLLRDLVRVELVERLALLARDARPSSALGLQPADDRARLHALAEPGQADVNRHCRPTVRMIAS